MNVKFAGCIKANHYSFFVILTAKTVLAVDVEGFDDEFHMDYQSKYSLREGVMERSQRMREFMLQFGTLDF